MPQIAWAGVLGAFGIVHLVRAARPSWRPDAGKGQAGIWSALVLLYLAVGLLAWGHVAAVVDNRGEQRRLKQDLFRTSQENAKLFERLRALEIKERRRP